MQGEPGVYIDLGEWEGFFSVNVSHWLEFKSSMNASFEWRGVCVCVGGGVNL